MKTIISTILAMAILASFSISVLATQFNETLVTYYVPENYTVNIPEIITVGQYEDNEVIITATTSLLGSQILNVSVASGIEYMTDRIWLGNGSSEVNTYLFYNDLNSNEEMRMHAFDPVAQFMGSNENVRDTSKVLRIKAINPEGVAAGTYTTTLQFEVSITDIVPEDPPG